VFSNRRLEFYTLTSTLWRLKRTYAEVIPLIAYLSTAAATGCPDGCDQTALFRCTITGIFCTLRSSVST
jgi:hypothetical protein